MVAALFAVLLGASGALAHTFERTLASFNVDAAGNFEVSLRLDLDALALGVDPATDPAVAAQALLGLSENEFQETLSRLSNLLSRRLRVRADGKPVPFAVSFPSLRPRPERDGVEVLGLTARLVGRLPAGAKEVSFFASRSFPTVELTFSQEGVDRQEFRICLQGEECPALKLGSGKAEAAWGSFIVVGFRHIVPLGLDHVLFVIALFLGGRDWKTLLIQTGLFTLAHSATLALSTFGVVSLSPGIVEPLIALSIGLVGLENVLKPTGVSRRRAGVVFLFGLLHGLGFAGVLAETPLQEGQKVVALLLFNLGVELGQIAVLAIALLASLPFKDPVRYRRMVERPLSIALTVVGLLWALQRIAS